MNIPNFQDIPVVVRRNDGNYYFSDQWRVIMQQLFEALQRNAGNEGLVAPPQPRPDGPVNAIDLIQNNTETVGGNTIYTCGYGRFLYDSTNNKMKVSIDDGFGAPIFKEIMLI